CPSMFRPVVLRVSPKLSAAVESVWGIAGDATRPAVPIELEKRRLAPDIGAVVSHEDGKVPDQPDAAPVGVLTQGWPLTVKFELHEAVSSDLVRQALAGVAQGGRLAARQGRCPVRPRLSTRISSHRHE